MSTTGTPTSGRSPRPFGGAAANAITIPDEVFEDYLTKIDFISRYIFLGGRLLSPGKMQECTERHGLRADRVRQQLRQDPAAVE